MYEIEEDSYEDDLADADDDLVDDDTNIQEVKVSTVYGKPSFPINL